MNTKSNITTWKSMSDPGVVSEIGRLIRQMRLNRNLTQKQLADMSGVSRVTISLFERGRSATLMTLVQILRALDKLDILDVFHEEAEISPLQLLSLTKKRRQRASGARTSSQRKDESR